MAEHGRDRAEAPARDLPGRIGDQTALARRAAAWKGRLNRAGVKADWQFTTADARTKLRKLHPTIDA